MRSGSGFWIRHRDFNASIYGKSYDGARQVTYKYITHRRMPIKSILVNVYDFESKFFQVIFLVSPILHTQLASYASEVFDETHNFVANQKAIPKYQHEGQAEYFVKKLQELFSNTFTFHKEDVTECYVIEKNPIILKRQHESKVASLAGEFFNR